MDHQKIGFLKIILASVTKLQHNNPDMSTTTYPTRGEILKLRALRRAAHAERCSVQAKRAKSNLIAKGKGKNGLSMNLELLHHHATIS